MDLSFLLRGILIGFSIAAPVGPIAVLCIRRTLTQGRTYGLISGLGAATADAIYGCIAGFGLTFISSILINQQMWLRLIGSVFLCYLGIRSFRSNLPNKRFQTREKASLVLMHQRFFLRLQIQWLYFLLRLFLLELEWSALVRIMSLRWCWF